MISHKYKCIFIHIPRTAGTSIESWIVGNDWWKIEPNTKHLLASQAKKIYSKYWDKYFKFAFIRNPWDRMVSCLAFGEYYGVNYNNGILNFDKYKELFGHPLTIEYDYRFNTREDVITKKHIKNSVYLNLLDEELDFIGRFESLEKDVGFIKKHLNIKEDFQFQNKIVASERGIDYRDYYDDKTRKMVADLYKKGIEKYNYEF